MSGFIPYLDLDAEDKAQIHGWLLDHRVDYHRVPVYAEFEYDAATSEWRIPLYWHDPDGRMRIDETGDDVRKVVVRRRELRPLPWPRVRLRLGKPTFISIGGVDVTGYVTDVTVGGRQ